MAFSSSTENPPSSPYSRSHLIGEFYKYLHSGMMTSRSENLILEESGNFEWSVRDVTREPDTETKQGTWQFDESSQQVVFSTSETLNAAELLKEPYPEMIRKAINISPSNNNRWIATRYYGRRH
eukprot:TRINITY_DN9660_c0_g4_i2.p1 TRINITY_DN9660_c0_g4~~TRINITY_DN9660_c0_g4_i2.p1  ORF type:complete len:124 (+),score=12.74 TRINITY_DN9660_c0_g4_i2:45-416(+)